jgi:phage recombination protein Bet
MTVEEEAARKAAYDAAQKRNADALGDINDPRVITNANAKAQLEANKPSQREVVLMPPTEEQPFNQVVVLDRQESPMFNPEQVALIKAKVAGNATQTEFELLMYMANKYRLDPLIRQIWLVKYGDMPAQIFAGRDGFLEIAHRSGHFNGMETKVNYSSDGKTIESATCTVWRNDMEHPFVSHVLFSEYVQPVPRSGKPTLWQTKPAVMIGKVAESVCLRKAFSVSGLYSPEEMD